MAEPIRVSLPTGGYFVSTTDPVSGGTPPMAECCKFGGPEQGCACPNDHTSDESSTLRYLDHLWTRARDAKATDHQRLAAIERLYRGQHFVDSSGARIKELEVTNFCYANVETVTGIFNKQRAMPRVESSRPLNDEKTKKIRELANWWWNRSRAHLARSLGNRIKTKFGMVPYLMTVDPGTGMPFIKPWVPDSYYPDPSAADLPGCEYHVFAGAIPTRRLRVMFPKQAHRIQPDSYTSPLWEVTRRVDEILFSEREGNRNVNMPSITNSASTPPYQGNVQPTGSTILSPSNVTARQRGAETTMFLQILVRDRTQQKWSATGEKRTDDGEGGEMAVADAYEWALPACESGWRVFYACPGVLLDQAPLDPCYGGVNFDIDYYTRHENRIEGSGEIEQVIPIQRSYNERKIMLQQSVRIAACGVLVATTGTGQDFDKRTVDAGDIVEIRKGSELAWLKYDGPNSQQFGHLETEIKDFEYVSGTNRSLNGIQPEGVRTAAQLKELQTASAGRIQAKMAEALTIHANILTKAVRVMAAKLTIPIMFRATDGTMMSVSREELAGEFWFHFPADETDLDVEERKKNDGLAYYQLGLIDRQAALEMLGIEGAAGIAMRMQQADMEALAVKAAAEAQAGGGPPKKGGGPPSGNGAPAQQPAGAMA